MTSRAPHLGLSGISKHFGEVVALDAAHFTLAPGTVHAILGENGAGKTTLMRIAFGMLAPDAGVVQLDGIPVRFRTPADAVANGIRMVQQHFSLVPALTVVENYALGGSGRFSAQVEAQRLAQHSSELGVSLEPHRTAAFLSPAEQQQLEIVKALGGHCRVLILDEPTAVLAPAQADALLKWLRSYAATGRSVVLITHKLRDALAVADDVTVLRRGRTMVSGRRADLTERQLIDAMLGAAIPVEAVSPRTQSTAPRRTIVALRNASAEDRGRREIIRDVTLDVAEGEIVGVAGLERSGYRLLLRVLAGRRVVNAGFVQIPGAVGFVPEDVRADALAEPFDVRENVALRGAGARRGWVDWRFWTLQTRRILEDFDVRAPNERVAVATLSGGNQQRLVLARELADAPRLIVAENPTRGLDVRAAREIRERLRAVRDYGGAVVFYSSDLDELIADADRIVVMYGGRLRSVERSLSAVGRALLGEA